MEGNGKWFLLLLIYMSQRYLEVPLILFFYCLFPLFSGQRWMARKVAFFCCTNHISSIWKKNSKTVCGNMYPQYEAIVTLHKSQHPFCSNRKPRSLWKQSKVLSCFCSNIIPRGIFALVETAVCATIPFLFGFTWVVYFIPKVSALISL